MAEQKVYPKGMIGFAPHANAPDWALGDLTISLDEFWTWLKNNPEYVTNYKGSKQLKLQVTRGKENRLSVSVNTWKPKEEKSMTEKHFDANPPDNSDDLPF